MSYFESLEDNIPRGEVNGFPMYYPPCHICGGSAESTSYSHNKKYTCRKCREILVQIAKEEKLSGKMEEKVKKLRWAINRIEKVADISLYERAIGIVKNKIDRPGWFQSTEEIMTALELLKKGYKIHHQVPILGYKVDFLIPDLKVVLEVDGDIFHQHKKATDAERDALIRSKMGDDWNVVRIKTSLINKNITRLVPAIKAVVNYRKKNQLSSSTNYGR